MKECSKFPLRTEFQNSDIDLSHSDYNSSLKLFTLCIHECLMNICTKFYPRTVSQSSEWRHTHRHTHTQTDGHEYSIVAVDKPQL